MAVTRPQALSIPDLPARDVEVRPIRELPPRPGLAKAEGQSRLLCDLASIELQAMEMGLRTLIEFPKAPAEFRRALARITLEEGLHLRLCLDGMERLGFPWGLWPVHIGLWRCLSDSDSLLDRILIVHRYLEGSGLDAGQRILKRLKGVPAGPVADAAERIARDEMAHVAFGSDWYREICRLEGLEPELDFAVRMRALKDRLPRKLEPLNVPVRKAAGFSDFEIEVLASLQDEWKRH